jgi:hypothetical protein
MKEENWTIEYTYPQLPIQTATTRPGSILNRQGGSIFNRREQLKASRRRFTLPPETPPKTFYFCNDLWDKLDQLHPAVLDAMHVLLSTSDQLAERPRHQPDRLRRRTKQEAPM